MITYEKYISDIWHAIDFRPRCLRKGQAVFNYIEQAYPGVGRSVMEEVDCFYNDSYIDQFIDACWKIIDSQNQK